MISEAEREPMLHHAGVIAAKTYGISLDEAIQGCRQASDALRKAGSDGTPADWVLLSEARRQQATTDEVEAFAADTVRLRRS